MTKCPICKAHRTTLHCHFCDAYDLHAVLGKVVNGKGMTMGSAAKDVFAYIRFRAPKSQVQSMARAVRKDVLQ